MRGGTISSNIANNGGGVYGRITLSSGTISGNRANESGGGVYVPSISNFRKTGGTITGYDSDQSNGNVVRNSSGIVQSYRGHAVFTDTKRKETTAGTDMNLSSSSNDGWDFY
jgi:predicted outer membrane repeat protein